MYDRGIEAFFAVASSRSLSKASELLHISQTAVSRRLKDLEEQLGITLVDRQKGVRSCELTLAGERFLPIAERWNRLQRKLHQFSSGVLAVSLRLGCVDSLSKHVMPDLYRALRAHDPPVYLRIFTTRSVELYDKIERRELDVAFVLQEKNLQNVEVTPFYKEKMMVAKMQDGVFASSKLQAGQLDPRHELYINWGPGHHIWHDQTWGPARKSEIELDSVELARDLIEGPENWVLVPESVMNSYKWKTDMAYYRLTPPPPDRITYMITHSFPRPGARDGLEIIKQIAEEQGFFNVG
ncbi:LysR family transcriptional regulator [Dethiosulfatarculus sandiegensis]|uniref:LysR family transcriptional regulator n=1 Tax=Dethiosulfatarculus sandiegensis TaxID=1429043 RepID=A0A0D2G774_9BACT|nr:LysR family transcriptional regulator [Dethiosulfatarculus sandiegensis]KIX10827.1 LysR family transcriptional regulator [Dethiosulfatarculus sandiegensis]